MPSTLISGIFLLGKNWMVSTAMNTHQPVEKVHPIDVQFDLMCL